MQNDTNELKEMILNLQKKIIHYKIIQKNKLIQRE